ncbi:MULTISPECIES: hypothetical protein [unclassified Streptomyces]|uniref:hypothetical protein n=1 Tax=unclassified Streptomyces TaxID=2593676 RepID=UPI00081DBE71|nr:MULTISPECIES: hypothetical protein [unclassified Streptomyces]MYZ33734.1 hypothetical protein [Streptomyces sp. SID4917]SCF61407.1 hypothetical protein GA0115259_100175 [Streptomyces sp. MnatMP-M17]
MTNGFDAEFGGILHSAREVLPEASVLRLEGKLRQIRAERPDLGVPEVVKMAFDVFDGEAVDARIALEEAGARVDEAAAAEAAHAASVGRIKERTYELDCLESQYPGRATMAEVLADAGISWAYLGLSEEDGILVEEIRRGMR